MVKDGSVTGFLDWARAFSGDPDLEFVSGEFRFFVGHNRREKFPEFREGYNSVGEPDISERKRKLYRAFIITGMMIGFSRHWSSNHSEERQREMRNNMREDLEELF